MCGRRFLPRIEKLGGESLRAKSMECLWRCIKTTELRENISGESVCKMSAMNQGTNWDLDGRVENESFSKYHFILCFTLKPKEHELLCEWQKLIH